MARRHKRKGSDPIPVDKVAVSSSPIHSTAATTTANDDVENNDETSSPSHSTASWFHSTMERLQQLQLQIESDAAATAAADDDGEQREENQELNGNNNTSLQGPPYTTDFAILQAQNELFQIAEACKSQLQQRLEQEQSILQHESEELYQQQALVQKLQRERDDLTDQIANLDEEARTLRQHIHQYQESIQMAQKDMDRTEEDASRQLVKLQHEVSLYASATGVKWHVVNDNHSDPMKTDKSQLLQGDLSVPSQQRLRQFSFDKEKETPFVIANKLWSMISGDDTYFNSLSVSTC